MVDQVGLELVAVFLPQPPECWDYRLGLKVCATTPDLKIMPLKKKKPERSEA